MAGLKIQKGDRVVVLSGKDKGKEGEVSRIFPTRRLALVDGVNVVKKHQRPTQQAMQGGIIDKDMPIHVSNLAVLSPEDGLPTRVGYRFEPDGTKVRICKRTGSDF